MKVQKCHLPTETTEELDFNEMEFQEATYNILFFVYYCWRRRHLSQQEVDYYSIGHLQTTTTTMMPPECQQTLLLLVVISTTSQPPPRSMIILRGARSLIQSLGLLNKVNP